MEKFEVEALIIGGGVAGVTIGRYLSKIYREPFLIEKNNQLAMEASSRNSEVIHAGIYYKKNSLKSILCIKGKRMLYQYLDENHIPFNKCGKYIVSSSKQDSEKLFDIYKSASEFGLHLEIDKKEIHDYSFLKIQNSLFSPSTGIFDSHSFIQSLKNDFESNGGQILLNYSCLTIEISSHGFEVLVKDTGSNEEYIVITKNLFNCSGSNAVHFNNIVANTIEYESKLVKGEYYSYSGKSKLDHLIYPLPQEDSLGVHATIDLNNQIRFGPSAYTIESIDYSISKKQKENFHNSIRSFWPSIESSELAPSYSGIRALVSGKDDFIVDKKSFGNNIFISILGYASPGLTSSLALGEYVYKTIKDNDL